MSVEFKEKKINMKLIVFALAVLLLANVVFSSEVKDGGTCGGLQGDFYGTYIETTGIILLNILSGKLESILPNFDFFNFHIFVVQLECM